MARVDCGSVAPGDVSLFGPFSTVCSPISNTFKIILKNNSLLKSYVPRFSVSFGLGRSRMSLTEKEEVLGILIERSLNKNDAHHDRVCFGDDCEIDHPHPHGVKLGKQNLQNGLYPGFIVFSFTPQWATNFETFKFKFQIESNTKQNLTGFIKFSTKYCNSTTSIVRFSRILDQTP